MLEGELGVITLAHEVVARILRATGELYTDVLGCYLDRTLAGAVSADSGRGQTFQIADEKPQPPTKPPDEDEAQITVLQRAIYQAIHPSSLACVSDDLSKDSWALSTVALHFFPEVSRKVAKVEPVPVLQESLTVITSSLTSFNWWKHSPQPFEHARGSSIDAIILIHMIKVLEIVDPTSDAISSIQTLQASCAKLMAGQSSTEPHLEWPMAAADINQLRFDSSLNSFGDLAATTIRKPIRMSTINFASDTDLDNVPWFRPLLTIEAFVSHAKIVVNARNGLFHDNRRPDYHKVYGSMLAIKEVLLELDTSEGCRSLDWEPVLPHSTDVNVRIVRSAVSNHDPSIVGRIEQASAIAALLDASVANQLRSQSKGALILEVNACDNSTFLHIVIPEAIQGILYNTDAAYSAITKHLEDWMICVTKAKTRLKQPRFVVLFGLIQSEPALLSVAALSHRHQEVDAKVEGKDEAPIVAHAVSQFGRLHPAISEHDKALALHHEARKLCLSCFGGDDQVSMSHTCIAAFLSAEDQFENALVARQEALQIRKLRLSEGRSEIESIVSSVISALNVVGRKDDARAMLVEICAMAANRSKNATTPTAEAQQSKPSSSGAKESAPGAAGASEPPQLPPHNSSTAAPDKTSKGKKGSIDSGVMCACCRKRAPILQACSRCKQVHYCSRKCQQKHWVDGGHKRFCKTLAARGTVSAATSGEAADEGDPVHRCPICLTNEDDSGSAGMCCACGLLFCGECNTPDKIGTLPCPTCRHPLPTVSDHDRVELLHKLLKRSPGRHTAPALHLLGNAYANAQGTAQDLELAFSLYLQAADQSVEAAITLGVCFERGEGTEEDHEEAVRLYTQAATQDNHRKAQFNLGNCYYVGKGVEMDRRTAFQWFKRAADQGYADAQLCVGSCYERGTGVKLDPSKAFEWFKKSADQGNIEAQHSVASSLLHGLGVPQDVARAVAALEIPAMRGHPMSQFNLGVILYKGREGVAQDLPKAIDWLRKAADQKHPGAQFNLGSAYSTGTGVAKDLPEAARLFALAADQGHDLAKRYLRRLLANHPRLREHRLTETSMAEALPNSEEEQELADVLEGSVDATCLNDFGPGTASPTPGVYRVRGTPVGSWASSRNSSQLPTTRQHSA